MLCIIYEFVNNTRLINPKLLLDLPADPRSGLEMVVRSCQIHTMVYDDNENIFLYITIGGVGIDGHKTKAQNVKNGGEPDGTSGILVITQDGKVISQHIAATTTKRLLRLVTSAKKIYRQILCIWNLE